MARGKSGKAGLPAPVQEAPVVVMLTATEAEEICGRIDRSLSEARALLVELHDREGWRALGFESWRECVIAKFGQHQSYLYRQLQAGQLEQALDLPIGTLPESHARELAKVPPEKRAEVLAEVSPIGEKTTAKAIAQAAATVCKFRVDDVVLTPEGRAVVTAVLKGKVRVDDGGDALTEHPIENLALIRHEAIFGAGERVINYGQGDPRHGTVQSVHVTQGVAVVAFDDGGSEGCALWQLDPEPEPEPEAVELAIGDFVKLPGYGDELFEVKGISETGETCWILSAPGAVHPWQVDELVAIVKQSTLLDPDLEQEDWDRACEAFNEAALEDAFVAEVQSLGPSAGRGFGDDQPEPFDAVMEDVELKIVISRDIWEVLNELPNPRGTMARLLERSLAKAFEAGELVCD